MGEGANGWTGSLAGDQRSSPNRESHGCHVVEREGETERERERKKERLDQVAKQCSGILQGPGLKCRGFVECTL